jgi:hypothetical protein
VVLSGNTIQKIMNGAITLINGTDYLVIGSTIQFKASYLNSLAVSDSYTLTIHYNPFGVVYPTSPLAGSEAPTTTQIVLTVKPEMPEGENISMDNRLKVTPVSREATCPSFHLVANAPISGYLYVASYDVNGRMVSIAVTPFSLAAGEETTVQATVPELPGCTYKFFIWDSNYIPMTAITSVSDLK